MARARTILARMCLIAIAWRAHPRYALVLAANRDEFHHRPSAAAGWWREAPAVFGGRDLSAGGSWLAVTRDGRLAAVTNVRRMQPVDPRAPSRGGLVAGFVTGAQPALDYAQSLAGDSARYAGYNLLLADRESLVFASNQPAFTARALAPGAHAISNASINTPWPKLRRLREGLAAWAQDGQEHLQQLWDILAEDRPAADAELPDTGVGLEMERFLSPPFIRGERYGTRASTVVTLDYAGALQFHERRYGPDGAPQGETLERIGR